MRTNDAPNPRTIALQQMHDALKANDAAAYTKAMDALTQSIGDGLRQEYDALLGDRDAQVLSVRGIRQLTSAERNYYQSFITAAKSPDPKQAIANMDLSLPETVINTVFDELETSHPLLSKINFMPSRGAVKLLVNTADYQQAAWGELCAEIVKEVETSFTEVDVGLMKISAFLPVCKSMLDMGPEWIDRFVRRTLYEIGANGLESAFISGTGKNMPIGMDRQVGAGVSVVDGVHPQKTLIPITDLTPATVGDLLSKLAQDANGKTRNVRNVILLVNPQDYYQKVMPATTIQAPDGTYRNDVLPYPVTVIQSPAVTKGEAIFGLAHRYFGSVGTDVGGKIEYSDHQQFLQDRRCYLIKAYANGFPMDNNAFLRLDITGLQPAFWRVQSVAAAAATAGADAE